jgi:hypothetical protein
MWHVTSQKSGMSALGLQRALGIGGYKTAWCLLHKLRRAMVRPGRELLSGTVEVDETYWGGEEEGMIGRQTYGKSLIIVAAEEDGRGIGRIRLACLSHFLSAPCLFFPPPCAGDSLTQIGVTDPGSLSLSLWVTKVAIMMPPNASLFHDLNSSLSSDRTTSLIGVAVFGGTFVVEGTFVLHFSLAAFVKAARIGGLGLPSQRIFSVMSKAHARLASGEKIIKK